MRRTDTVFPLEHNKRTSRVLSDKSHGKPRSRRNKHCQQHFPRRHGNNQLSSLAAPVLPQSDISRIAPLVHGNRDHSIPSFPNIPLGIQKEKKKKETIQETRLRRTSASAPIIKTRSYHSVKFLQTPTKTDRTEVPLERRSLTLHADLMQTR